MIARALGVALVVSVGAFGVQTWRLGSAQEALHEQERMAAAELIKAEQQARKLEQEFAANARKAGQIYATQQAKIRADADGARSELERLRLAVDSGGVYAAEGAASAARADVTARLAGVVNECAAALQTMASTADRTAAQLTALQAYVTGITKE